MCGDGVGVAATVYLALGACLRGGAYCAPAGSGAGPLGPSVLAQGAESTTGVAKKKDQVFDFSDTINAPQSVTVPPTRHTSISTLKDAYHLEF